VRRNEKVGLGKEVGSKWSLGEVVLYVHVSY